MSPPRTPGEPRLRDAVAALMGDHGPLARADTAYRERPEQLKMAAAVADAIEGQTSLVVEAGTGVGKTYAYLIPLLLSGQRGLVSTATKSLQDQLFWRDLPRLCDTLGVAVRTALLKGRSSYLCRHRLSEARHVPGGLDRSSLRVVARLEDWARSTVSGDLSEVEGLDDRSPVIPLVTSTRDNCLGSECPAHAECHVMLARREAMAADLVVVNHHLFFADLALKDGGMAELLPAVEVVVLDEAHQALDTGLQFVATSLGSLALADLAQDLRAGGLQHARGLQEWVECSQAIEQAARDLALACEAGQGARRVNWAERDSGRPEGQARPIEVAFREALAAVESALRAAQAAAAAVAEAHPDLARLRDRADALAQRTASFREPAAVDRVRWIDVSTHQVRLTDTPLDIRELLTKQQEQTRRAWVFTSATLGDEPTLTWFRRQAGLETAQVMSLGSPYDYAGRARVWVPSHLPLPGTDGHTLAVAHLAARCASRLGGRTFVLATTLKALSTIGDEIRRLYEERSIAIDVLVQGALPKRVLLERFIEAGTGRGAVLVGAQSFWEGIDVPGSDLQCVLIDKLPFPPPDDPLLQARARAVRAEGGDPFRQLHLAEAAISLKQGAGRLIRSERDQGLLVLCDTRLLSKPYGPHLMAALPPMQRLESSADAGAWIEALRQGDGRP